MLIFGIISFKINEVFVAAGVDYINTSSKYGFLQKSDLQQQILEAREGLRSIIVPQATFQKFLGSKGVLKKGAAGEKQRISYEKWANQKYIDQVDSQILDLYSVYLNSFQGGKLESNEGALKILGCEDIRDKSKAKHELQNFEMFNEVSSGCILNSKKWNLLVNDVAILGAIHAQQDFGIWSQRYNIDDQTLQSMQAKNGEPSIDDDILWDAKENRPRATGRELIMLREAGYKRLLNHPELGVYFVNVDSKLAISLTIDKVCEAASKAQLADIKAFLTGS